MAPKPEDGPPGQNKTWTITKPATGESRTVTTREWREQQLGRDGWEKPADMPEESDTDVVDDDDDDEGDEATTR